MIDGAVREKVKYGRPDRMASVASSHAWSRASSTISLSSVMPVRTSVKSCSRSHVFGLIFITLWVRWLLRMRTKIYFSPNVSCVVFRNAWGTVHRNATPVTRSMGAKQPSPGVTVRMDIPPPHAFGILNRAFNVWVGVAWACHPRYYNGRLTAVKREISRLIAFPSSRLPFRP